MCECPEKCMHHLLEEVRRRSHIDQTYQISSSQAYIVDYKQRKHIYIWSPTAISLTIEDYGTGSIPAQQWINIGIRDGCFVTAPAVTSGTTPLMVRCTDEVVV